MKKRNDNYEIIGYEGTVYIDFWNVGHTKLQ